MSKCYNPVHSRRTVVRWGSSAVEDAIWLGALLGRAGCSCLNRLGQFGDPWGLRRRRGNEEATVEVVEARTLAAIHIVAGSETFASL